MDAAEFTDDLKVGCEARSKVAGKTLNLHLYWINLRDPFYFLEALRPKTSQLVYLHISLCTELTLLGQDQGLVHSLCFLLGLTRSCIVAIWQIIGLGSPSLNFTAESHSLGSPAPWPFLSFWLWLDGVCWTGF